jgi:hypothetical protein
LPTEAVKTRSPPQKWQKDSCTFSHRGFLRWQEEGKYNVTEQLPLKYLFAEIPMA